MKNVLIDFHGCLTSGRMSISHTGEYLFDHVHVRDIRAIRELIARGFYVAIVTASSSPIVESFADKVGAALIVARNKTEVIPLFGDFVALGDDAWDVALLNAARRAFCPADADASVKAVEGIEILKTNGGNGVIAEMLPLLS